MRVYESSAVIRHWAKKARVSEIEEIGLHDLRSDLPATATNPDMLNGVNIIVLFC